MKNHDNRIKSKASRHIVETQYPSNCYQSHLPLIGLLALAFLMLPAQSFGQTLQTDTLGPDLTPTGAQLSGNEAGTIPSWTGGVTAPPPDYVIGAAYIDIFADDEPILEITAKNAAEHADKLSEAHKQLFKLYPETYKMTIYPSRRSCAWSQKVYQAIERNSKNAKLVNDGNGIDGALMSTPFPKPTKGIELYWNHNLHYKGYKTYQKITGGTVYPDGTHVRVVREDKKLNHYGNPDIKEFSELNNIEINWTGVWSAPIRNSGSGFSMKNPIDQTIEPRSGSFFSPDTRKVMKATPSRVTYEAPMSTAPSMRISDDMFLFNGAPDRYDWKLIGKKELYIPYNSYKSQAEGMEIADLLLGKHLNPEHIRYELHRVWVVEASLKEGARHPYKRRVIYFDEDSWIATIAEIYDNDDVMVAGQVGFVKNHYDVPACFQDFDVKYNFDNGQYNVDNLNIEFGVPRYDTDIRENDFGASALRRAINR